MRQLDATPLLPRGWTKRFWNAYDHARQQFGEIGVLGVYGVRPAARMRRTFMVFSVVWLLPAFVTDG